MKCNKCKKHKVKIKYKDGQYCTWYCAKKKLDFYENMLYI